MTTSFYKKSSGFVCIGAGLLYLVACVQDPQSGVDSELSISPGEREFPITELRDSHGRCFFNEQFYQDMPLQIVFKTADHSPIGGAEISVYVYFAGNTFSGLHALGLYADSNGNGVVDAPDELVSGADDDIYRVKTGRYDGSVFLLLRINLSCSFRGRVVAFSGSANGAMEVNVTASSIVQ